MSDATKKTTITSDEELDDALLAALVLMDVDPPFGSDEDAELRSLIAGIAAYERAHPPRALAAVVLMSLGPAPVKPGTELRGLIAELHAYDVSVGIVDTSSNSGGFEVSCWRCGKKGRMASPLPPGNFLTCPGCLRSMGRH